MCNYQQKQYNNKNIKKQYKSDIYFSFVMIQ